ncbi:unnamed protein product [Didymodactylos carnosus]|uniref:RING-type E3 ubiquitin transferase n=1 Tax=Didymodactylos carnosus TaxID=1234261 RepID=A0A8S2HFR5_9BILA|nr:unnamed protein product [Didymodactylos carnosus]CAF3641088.1 unnamed protein product [Didymodactylos carnosus]
MSQLSQRAKERLAAAFFNARENIDFENVYEAILICPEWLTLIPQDRRWAILHQIVYHGEVDKLDRLLSLQGNNPKFRILSPASDGQTVLDIAKDETKPMFERINRLKKMDDMLNYAKERNWTKCKELIQERPEIINEKPPYRYFYLIHHLAYSGDTKIFDDLRKKYHFDLNLVVGNNKTAYDIACENEQEEFANYLNQLKTTSPRNEVDDHPKSNHVEIVRNLDGDVLLNKNDTGTLITSLSQLNIDNNLTNEDDNNLYDYIRRISDQDMLQAITDPISKKILQDPVLASDGYTYERKNILKWFEKSKNSPVNGTELKDFELKPNKIIEQMIKAIVSRSMKIQSSSAVPFSTYYKIQQGDTLANIANAKHFTLDEMKAANPELENYDSLQIGQIIKLPLVQRLIDKTVTTLPVSYDTKPVYQHSALTTTTTTTATTTAGDQKLIPETIKENDLEKVKTKFHEIFLISDKNGDGQISLDEFKLFLNNLGLKTLKDADIEHLFLEINRNNKLGISSLVFQNFYDYFLNMIQQNTLHVNERQSSRYSQVELDLFRAFLKADSDGICAAGGITTFINERWKDFNHFKREGREGKLVMIGGDEATDVLPGVYSLLDLICSTDEQNEIRPKYVKICDVRWISSTNSDQKVSGELIFPTVFDGKLPIDIATNSTLSYYGCCLANESGLKVSLLNRHAIQDFTYESNYFMDFVSGRAGLERHGFAHLDTPTQEESGFFILGKMVNDNELHLTAFKIPTKHSLYVPPMTIHSNDYMRVELSGIRADHAWQVDAANLLEWKNVMKQESKINQLEHIKQLANNEWSKPKETTSS